MPLNNLPLIICRVKALVIFPDFEFAVVSDGSKQHVKRRAIEEVESEAGTLVSFLLQIGLVVNQNCGLGRLDAARTNGLNLDLARTVADGHFVSVVIILHVELHRSGLEYTYNHP